MSPLTRDEYKELLREVLTEWLDHKYALFGRWSVRALVAMLMACSVYLALKAGWRPV